MHVRYKSLYISLPSSAKQRMKRPHSTYCRDREIRLPIFKISFSNFDAVKHILYKMSLTVIDKFNKCKFLRHSWVENKVVF